MSRHLVSTQWLEDHLDEPNLRIVDIRGKALTPDKREASYLHHYGDYTEGHIPGAVFVNWVEDITDDPQHKRIAPPGKFAHAMGKLGITNEHFVVVYDDASNALSARLWWALHYYGHTQVAVLDGGWYKWLAEARPVTAEMPEIEWSEFTAQPHDELLTQGDDIVQLLSSTARIVDMRLPDEYNGQISLTRLRGHIPGAASLPVNRLMNNDNTLLSPEQLRERLAEATVDKSAPKVIFYGNVGVVACLGLLAMRVAGLTNPASIYDASWQEWGNDERKPVATA